MSAPLRKIVHTCDSHRRTRRGILHTSTLECGHLDTTTARERRQGRTYCFDCFYGKPQHPQAIITLAELGAAT